MARIIIELTDSIDGKIDTKIKGIGTSADSAEQSVLQLQKSLSSISGTALSKNAESASRAMDSYFGATERAASSIYELSVAEKSRASIINQSIVAEQKQLAIELAESQALKATELNIYGVTNATNARTQAINRLIVSEERQRQIEKNLQSGGLSVASNVPHNNLFTSGGAVDSGGKEIARITGEQERLAEATKKTNFELFTFHNLFIAFAVIRIADKIREIVDSYTLMQNRLQLVANSIEETRDLQRDMFKIANDARVPVNELTQSFVRYDYALSALGASQRESIQFTKTLTQQLQISGLTTAESSSALLQLSQALNKGKLDGDEFRTIMETLPTLATAIAKEMGVARGELIRLAPQGKITAQIIRDAMAAIADDTEESFNKLAPTIGQALTVAKNKIIEDVGKINDATGASSAFAQGIIFTSKNIDTLAIAATAVSTVMLLRYVPSMTAATAATARFSAATGALIKSPFFIYAVAAIAAYKGLEYAITGNLEAQDKQTEADNKKADEFEKQQSIKVKALKYETESHIKLRQEYDKYLSLIEENKRGVLLKLITAETAAILEEESSIGKLILKAKELVDFGGKSLTDNQKLEKEIYESEKLYNKSISDLQSVLRVQKELRDASAKDFENSVIRESAFKAKMAKDKATPGALYDSTNAENAIKKEIDMQKNLQKAYNSQNDLLKITNDLIEKSAQERDKNTEAIKREMFAKENLKIEEEYSKSFTDKFDFEIQKIKEIRDERAKAIQEQIKLGILSADSSVYNLVMINTIALDNIQQVDRARQESYEKEMGNSKELEKQKAKEIQDQIDLQDKLDHEKTKSFIEEFDRAMRIREEYDNSSRQTKLGLHSNDPNEQSEELKRLETERVLKFQAYKDTFSDQYLLTKEFQDKIKSEKELHEKVLLDIDRRTAEAKMDISANMFGALSGLASEFAENGRKGAKVAFGITQGLAYAEAIVSMASAISKANASAAYPYNIPAIVTAGAIGGAQIASITKATIKGFAQGGYVGGSGTSTSDSIAANLSRNEYVVNAIATSRHRSLLEAINADNGSSTSSINNTYLGDNRGGAKTNIIINNNHNGAQVEARDDGNGNIEIMVEQIDAHLAKKYADGNGKLAKAIDGKRLRNF